MAQMFKRSLVMTLMAVVLLMGMAASAFASSENYQFNYNGSYHAHSSSYIAGPADVDGGNVTITLTGDYFPQVDVGGVSYYGSYNSTTNLTTLTFPGDTSDNINLKLYVVAGPHSTAYDLELEWQ